MLNKNKNKIMSAHKEYEFLKANGVLLEVFPELSGDWLEDEKTFTERWELNVDIFNNLDVIIEDDDEE